MPSVVEIRDLVINFYTFEGVVEALARVNLEVLLGETLGLVGETGSGKTVTGLALLGIVLPPGRVEGGQVLLRRDGELIDITKLRANALRQIRGREISIVFQEPNAALNPVYSVGTQIAEAFYIHRWGELCQGALKEVEGKEAQGGVMPWGRAWHGIEKALFRYLLSHPNSILTRLILRLPLSRLWLGRIGAQAWKLSVELLKVMGLADPERIAHRYPHELSGGMKQRVCIAMALACHPRLLVADEPTTALDVTIQAQILDLLRKLKQDVGATIIYITHNLGVVAEMCDRVAVMYAGSIAEVAEVKELFRSPLHPYTQALLKAIPRPGEELQPISGTVPSLIHPPSGCRFHPRCPYAMPICPGGPPPLEEVAPGHRVACYLYY